MGTKAKADGSSSHRRRCDRIHDRNNYLGHPHSLQLGEIGIARVVPLQIVGRAINVERRRGGDRRQVSAMLGADRPNVTIPTGRSTAPSQ